MLSLNLKVTAILVSVVVLCSLALYRAPFVATYSGTVVAAAPDSPNYIDSLITTRSDAGKVEQIVVCGRPRNLRSGVRVHLAVSDRGPMGPCWMVLP